MQAWHETTPPAGWAHQQNVLQAHILQRHEWGQFQNALRCRTFYASGDMWSWLAVLEKGRFGNRLYCPYGPTVQKAKALGPALNALRACAKAVGAMYIRVEPQGPLAEKDFVKFGLQPAHRNIQPRYTWVKDLTKTEDELLAEMSATNRNLYRTADNKGVSFRASTDPKDTGIFLDMIHEVAGRNAITPHPDDYFKIMAATLMPLGALKLYVAEAGDKAVATSLVLDSPTTRYYAHAGSYASARRLHPGTPLVGRMLFDAKADGKTAFDFYGIAPPDQPNHPWAGFTQFKQSFGGHTVDRHGTWELPVNKLTYGLYRLAAKFV
jgi:lipid II:glycine glycyltransferase (peptidoglycan interpeptide bridge formation enzyme)